MYIFNSKSKFKLFDLVKRKEQNYYICGRKETEIYITTSQVGYEIIKLVEKEYTVGEITTKIHKRFGSYNVERFLNFLINQGYVDKIDDRKLHQKITKVRPFLRFVNPIYINWLFSKPMYFVYLLIFFLSFFILISNTSFFPVSKDYFISDRYYILIPLAFAFSVIAVVLHELMHFLAAKSHKLVAQFGLSNRLYFLVATTDITNIYSLKRKKRFRIILAGISTDIIVFSLSIIALYLHNTNLYQLPLIAYKSFKFMALIEFLGILWQFLLFLRTDLYYFFENLIGVYNLNEKTELFIKNEFHKLFNKSHFSTHFESKKERNIVYFYSFFFLVGILILLYNFLYYYIPIIVSLLFNALQNIVLGIRNNLLGMLYDALIFIIFLLFNLGLLTYGIIKHNRLYLRKRLYYLALFSLLTSSYLIIFSVILAAMATLNKFVHFYSLIIIISLIFALFIVYLAMRLDKISRSEFYIEE